jgi:Co/Zn/Cd efflux system component
MPLIEKSLHMSAHCTHHAPTAPTGYPPAYRRILWIALVVNFAMFGIEIGAGLRSDSVALLADAIDFFGDGVNYALALAVLGMASIWGSRVALLKAVSMIGFGLFLLGRVLWSYSTGITPEPVTMGAIGLLALLANLFVAALLYRYREGNANMRAVWLCTRNDALGNIAVMLAAIGVLGSGTAWPDWIVAVIMASLALHSGTSVGRQARAELQHANSDAPHP